MVMDERGVMSRVYQRGKTWYIDYSHKGRRIRSKVGTDKKTAELALKNVEVKLAKEEHLGYHEIKKMLFSDFADKYLAWSKANKKFKSYDRDVLSLRKHLIPYFQYRHLDEITTDMIEQYKLERIKNVKPATVNRELQCLRHLLKKAVQAGYLQDNPANNVKKFREPPGRIRYLEVDEIDCLLNACSPHIKPLVITALHTGMRRSELLSLKWSNINFYRKTITLERTKNNEPRTIPMSETVCRELGKLKRKSGSDYVFSDAYGSPIKSIRKAFENALKRAGIENFTFHDLRHTFASQLVMNDCSLRAVQELLGHKDIKSTMRYSHLSHDYLHEAVNSLDQKFKLGTNLAHGEIEKILDVHKPL